MSDEQSSRQNGLGDHSDKGVDGGANVIVARSTHPDGNVIDSFIATTAKVEFVETANAVHELQKLAKYDLVLIDSVLSDLDTISAVRLIRSADSFPYIMVRAETDDEIDRVLALEIGADDCFASSCGYRELKARIRAFLRRHKRETIGGSTSTAPSAPQSFSTLLFFDWVLDKNRCELLSPLKSVINLTQAEYVILAALFSEPDVTKDRYSLRSFDTESGHMINDRSLDVVISRLRKKIMKSSNEDLIQTVRGKGYRLKGARQN
ncbi:winged helix-turn-helix domain-containing protein [Sphingomonas sp. Leaf339]|uniref:winged helix-turn-helix domain-containing protein n=1 Tax=Sphingomonas sp. Leaf339 TaxID=1736343 RepID=UPI000A917532|nr:response regulator transcription factor [Sphingomonas sp. Leaf339]